MDSVKKKSLQGILQFRTINLNIISDGKMKTFQKCIINIYIMKKCTTVNGTRFELI